MRAYAKYRRWAWGYQSPPLSTIAIPNKKRRGRRKEKRWLPIGIQIIYIKWFSVGYLFWANYKITICSTLNFTSSLLLLCYEFIITGDDLHYNSSLLFGQIQRSLIKQVKLAYYSPLHHRFAVDSLISSKEMDCTGRKCSCIKATTHIY